jgi:hypothetical protein
MVLGGRSYLVVGGRRLGIGDKFGEARIERFDDGAVWIKEAGVTRRISLYEGVVKRRAAPVSPAPAGAKTSAAKAASLRKAAPAAPKNIEQEKP